MGTGESTGTRRRGSRGDSKWFPASIAALLGITLVAVARWDVLPEWLASFLDQLGGLALAAIAIGWLWEWRGKETFTHDVLDKVQLSGDIVRAGITSVGDIYLEHVDWAALFAGATKIDVVVAYGRTWRNNHATRLAAFFARPQTRLRVVLPDPEDPQVLGELARRFVAEPAGIAASIREAASAYLDLREHLGAGSAVEGYFRDTTPTYAAYYRFDDRRVFTMYNNRRERGDVPTFTVQGGTLGQFLSDDFHAMLRQSRAANLSQGVATMSGRTERAPRSRGRKGK